MVEAHPDYGYALAPSLREADKREISATFPGVDHGYILEEGIKSSDMCFAICEQHTIRGLWGHGCWSAGGTQPGDMGYVWMLTDGELFKRHRIKMTRMARSIIFPALDKTYSSYGNWVHSKNLVHVRWLLGAGFKMHAHHKVNGEPFSLYLRCAHPL